MYDTCNDTYNDIFTICFVRRNGLLGEQSNIHFTPCFSEEKHDETQFVATLKQDKIDKILCIDDNDDIKISPTYMFLAIHKKMWDIMESYRPSTILIKIIYHDTYVANDDDVDFTNDVYEKSTVVKLGTYRDILDGLTEVFDH